MFFINKKHCSSYNSSGVEQPASSGYISSNPQHIQAAAKNWTPSFAIQVLTGPSVD